jgi:hypothetical protein
MAKRKKQTGKGGPYLAAALLCETIIEDKQDGAMSAIRIVDQFSLTLSPTTPPDFPSEAQRLPVHTPVLLMFKTGNSPGEHVIRLDLESPSGKSETVHEQTISFGPKPNAGANLRFNANIAVHTGGVFWLHVFLDGKEVTLIPFEITIQRAEAVQQPAGKPTAK